MSDSETTNANDNLIPENSVSEPVSPIDKILDYVTETPGNTNRAVLRSMLSSLNGTSSYPNNIVYFDYYKAQNTNFVECIITSDDIIEPIKCNVHLITTDGSSALVSTDWHYLNKEDEVPENIIQYYNIPLLNCLPIEVYSVLLQYIQDNNTTKRIVVSGQHFQEQSQDSSTFDPDTPLQPPEQEA